MRHVPAYVSGKPVFLLAALLAATAAARAAETIPTPAAKQPDASKAGASAKQAEPAEKPGAAKKPDSRDGRCDLCGGCECVRKVCVPKPKEREIKKVCWSYKCEDFCVPGPSRFCGRVSGPKDECGCWSYDVWKPGCAELRTKKVPVKTEVKRKVPGVEWVPEERCAACRRRKTGDPASPRP